MNKTPMVVTHDGIFHADDVCAVAILTIAFPGLTVERTRDSAFIRHNKGAPGVIMVDVGGEYDAERNLFDHHQPLGAGFRNAEEQLFPYASAGLIWKAYGRQAIQALQPALQPEDVNDTLQAMDAMLFRYVDAIDCGVKLRSAGPTVSALISSFNHSWYEEADESNFQLVLDLMVVIISNLIKRHAGKIYGRGAVRAAPVVMDGRVLVLDSCVPWTEIVADEMPEVMLVAYPLTTKPGWLLKVASADDGSNRILLPEAWAGTEEESFRAASGQPDGIFCHRARFLAGAQTKEGVLALAEKTLNSVSSGESRAISA